MKGTENDYIIGKIRNDTTWTYNPTFPLLHTPPEHVQPLLEVLCEWFNSWWKTIPTMSTSEVTEFALSIIPRIVLIHPYMDGNKRTSRFLVNVILHHRNLSIFKWNFKDMQLMKKYRHSFGRTLMRGDLASCVDLCRFQARIILTSLKSKFSRKGCHISKSFYIIKNSTFIIISFLLQFNYQ